MDTTRQAQDKPGFKLEHKQPSQEIAGFANVPLMGSVQLREPGTNQETNRSGTGRCALQKPGDPMSREGQSKEIKDGLGLWSQHLPPEHGLCSWLSA